MAGSLVYPLAPVVLETRDTEEHAGAGDDYLNKTPFLAAALFPRHRWLMTFYVIEGGVPGIYTEIDERHQGVIRKFATLGAAQLFLDYRSGRKGSIAIERVYISATMYGDPTHFVPCCGFSVFFGTNNPNNIAAAIDEVDNVELHLPSPLRAYLWSVLYCLKVIHERLVYKRYRGKTVVYVLLPLVVDIMTNKIWKWSGPLLVANADLTREIQAISANINTHYLRLGWGEIEFKYIPKNQGHQVVEMADRMAHSGAARMGLYEIRYD